MPAIRTPTITQQRIVLVVFMAIIGAAAWWQNRGGSVDYPVRQFSSTALPELVAELDFANAEAAWSGLQIDAQGSLQVNALTETALAEIIALMRKQTSERTSQLVKMRAASLLEKQFGSTASRQAMELLPLLERYKNAEQRWLVANSDKNPMPHAELFQLQDEFFGKALAEKMFAQQRRLANAMLAIQQVRDDPHLTQEQRERALTELEKALQAQGASVE